MAASERLRDGMVEIDDVDGRLIVSRVTIVRSVSRRFKVAKSCSVA